MSEWYKEWFESDLYTSLYSHRNDEDAKQLVNLILEYSRIKSGNVFDCPCGNGRHSIHFAKLGFSVTSMDLSKNLLDIFLKKLKEENLVIQIIRGNILFIPVKMKFDLILNLFTSFGYFNSDTENFSFFQQCKVLLKENAVLVFDYFNSDSIRKNLIPEEEKRINNADLIISRKIVDDFVEKKIKIIKGLQERVYFEKVKLYDIDFITNQLNKLGYKIEQIFGSYSGEKYDRTSSERLILFLKK